MFRLMYAFSEMVKLRKNCGPPSSVIIQKLKTHNILHSRGRRAGQGLARQIKVIKTSPNRKTNKPTANKLHCHFEIPTVRYNLPSVFLSNVTSLSNKIDELSTVITDSSPGIIAITEAWQFLPDTVKFDNYKTFHNLRCNKRGGGVALFVNEALHPSPLPL
ncbi:hypothetical protein Pcinc_033764 [Petrolisthes cinctipes]|uniref:Uncharacterized protein n=1 Tax=Petrolisthes cinctipes TaxID=88211 RepID=A0AAE1K185_PETCI|nr:hypothetical protein Pcinc_033764 [Petrolisthes cinctipes]